MFCLKNISLSSNNNSFVSSIELVINDEKQYYLKKKLKNYLNFLKLELPNGLSVGQDVQSSTALTLKNFQ